MYECHSLSFLIRLHHRLQVVYDDAVAIDNSHSQYGLKIMQHHSILSGCFAFNLVTIVKTIAETHP